MRFVVRGFDPADLEGLLAIQHATIGRVGARWSREFLTSQLTDPGRDHGRRVVVVVEGDRVRAGAGYVPAGDDLFIAPMLCDDEAAGVALVKEIVDRAAGAARVRVSVYPGEDAKRRTLEGLGFSPALAFITLARLAVAGVAEATGFLRVPVADVPAEVMREVHNRAFAGVSNAPPQTLDEVRHVVAQLFVDGSGVWFDGAGIGGYLWALREVDSRGEYLVIDAIGVAGDRRRTGLGRAMLVHALDAAARAGVPEVRALVASDNVASLALHGRVGFTELWRRDVYELAPH